jgi:O-antigen ligase
MQLPVTQADRVYFALAAAGGAAYVYRFAAPLGNVSLFRIAIVVGAVLLIGRWARHGADLAALRMLPFLAAATIGPAVDFIRLPPDSVHRVELTGYIVNLVGMVLMFSAVSSRAAALDAVRWFGRAAVLAIAIAWYALITGEIPAEQLLRSYGSEYTRELSYLNVSEGIVRLTGPFFDPNFFGAYLVMSIACCLVMWETSGRSRWLALAVACAASMLLTTSRTALLGLIVLVAIWGSGGLKGLGRRSLALLGALTVAVLLAGEFWQGFYDRLLNMDLTRLEFIERGWSAFTSDPLLGGGASALEDPESGYATAHTLYLSALGKYGIIGGTLLLVFIFAPLLAAFSRRTADPLSRRFVAGVILPLAAMYLTYDFFMFLEFQFLLFGMVYAVAFRGIRLAPHHITNRRVADLRGNRDAAFGRGAAEVT